MFILWTDPESGNVGFVTGVGDGVGIGDTVCVGVANTPTSIALVLSPVSVSPLTTSTSPSTE